MKLKKGDYIKCSDAEEAADIADILSKEGIEWDFVYQKDGQKGIWIEILKGEKQWAGGILKQARNTAKSIMRRTERNC